MPQDRIYIIASIEPNDQGHTILSRHVSAADAHDKCGAANRRSVKDGTNTRWGVTVFTRLTKYIPLNHGPICWISEGKNT